MRRFSRFVPIVATVFLILFSGGCSKKSADNGAVKMHWDRDMCERCKMAVSERKFAVQVINPDTHKVYKFDDIGCAVLWFDEEHIPWKDRAKIWITDAKTGEWIDARTAKYTDDSITPMAYGFAAYTDKTFPEGHVAHDYDYAVKKIFQIERLNTQKVEGAAR
jgi:nitrous oxide reductase accessory protein NosL